MKTRTIFQHFLPALLLLTILGLVLSSQAGTKCMGCKFAAEEETTMPYCTQADIEVMLPSRSLQQMTDDSQGGVTDEDKLAAIIAGQDAVIDGYLRGLYTVPLTTVPVEIRDLSRDMVIYELYRRRGEIPPQWEGSKKDAERRLRDIKTGVLVLNLTPPDTHQSVPILVDKDESDQVFPKDLLDRF